MRFLLCLGLIPLVLAADECKDNHPHCAFWASQKAGTVVTTEGRSFTLPADHCDWNAFLRTPQGCPVSCGTCPGPPPPPLAALLKQQSGSGAVESGSQRRGPPPGVFAGRVGVTSDEACPDVETKAEFRVEDYMGRWFEIQRYPNYFQEPGTGCVIAEYDLSQDGTIKVNNTAKDLTGGPARDSGIAKATVEASGKLLVQFPRQPFPGKYWVLDTDYESFTVVWSCSSGSFGDLVPEVAARAPQGKTVRTLWILARTPQIEPELLSQLRDFISSKGIDLSPMMDSEQSEAVCGKRDTVLPSSLSGVKASGSRASAGASAGAGYGAEVAPKRPPPGASKGPNGAPPMVISDKACPAVETVSSFDVGAYMGRWYEIQSYPNPFQVGLGCTKAEYTLLDGDVVKVNNTGVNITSGAATGAVGDAIGDDLERGKLLVKFDPNQPFRGNYWVLDVDYAKFSVVYSCQQIGPAKSLVFLWILSREPTLDAALVEKLRGDMAAKGLDLAPLSPTVQTEELCGRRDAEMPAAASLASSSGPLTGDGPRPFVPFVRPPLPSSGPPPFVMADEACPAVETVEGFRTADYMGRWFDVQRYPQPFQIGLGCSSPIYALLGDGTVQVNNSAVRLSTGERTGIIGTATPVDEARGKLSVRFGPSDRTAGMYWVLDTDYTSFAVVYACRDTEAGKSRRSLWILSRTPEMAPELLAEIRADLEGRGLDLDPLKDDTQSEEVCGERTPMGPSSTGDAGGYRRRKTFRF